MADEGISTKVSVLGDKEYKKALQDIGRRLTVLNTEMAATTSAFGDQADSMAAMQAKAASLKNIYDAQAEKVKLVAEQLNKAKAEYGENSQQAQNLQIALNRARAAMNKTGNEIEKNGRDMDELTAATQAADKSTYNMATASKEAEKAVGKQADAADEAEKRNTALSDAMDGVGSVASGAMKAGLEAAATAIAMLSAAALAGAKEVYQLGTDYAQATGQLSAQTGATGEELTELGGIAQRVYTNNFGDNIKDVNSALATTKINTGLVGDELQRATESGYMLRDTFGMDFAESSRAASALVQKFGITADKAYNLIALGAQKGANQNGDMLDVIAEYAPKYAEMGLTADDFFKTMIAGAEGGVFQIDKVGDAVKEFSIRAIDGSETTNEAFKSLGLNATYVAAKIAEGGPQARDAFLEVVNALQRVEDPVKRNQLAVALFGTQFEDLGEDALPILASIAEGGELSTDALSQINDVKYNDAATKLEGVRRKIEAEFLPLANNMQSLIVGTLSTIDTALADGFQPEDVRVVGEAVASALMEGIATISSLISNNMGTITAMLDTAVGVITEALPALVEAILPAAMGLLQSVVDAITANIEPLADLAANIVTNVAAFLVENASGLVDAAASLVTGLVDGIAAALPTLLPATTGMVAQIATGLAESLPMLMESAGGLLQGIVDGIIGALPVLVEALPQLVTTITDAITSALPDMLTQGTSILTNIVSGITGAIPSLAEAMPQIITTIITAITDALPDILAQGTSILTNIITGIGNAIPTLIAKMPEVLSAITAELGEIYWATLVLNLIQGLVEGLSAAVASLLESIKSVFVSIWDAIKGVFGINSPSTLAAEAGGFILDGLVQGFTSAVDAVCETVKAIFGKIWDAIKSIFGFGSESEESKEAKAAGQDIMTGMKDGITGSEDAVKEAVKTAAASVLTILKTELGITDGTSTKTKPMGTAMANGISDGLGAVTTDTFKDGVSTLAAAVANAINAAFGVEGTGFAGWGEKSAKEFEAIGTAVCKAVADGITNNTQNTEAVKTAITGVANAAYTAAVDEMATGITGGSETVNAAVGTVATDALDAVAAILTNDAGGEIGKSIMDGIQQAVQSARPNLVIATTQTSKAAHDASKREMSMSNGQSIGTALMQGIRAGITGQQSQVTSAAQSLGNGAMNALWGAVGSGGSRFEGIGSAIAQGVARGIRNGSSTIISAAKAAAQAAYNAAKRELDIRSPSHKMEAVGLQYDQGFAGGIEKGMEGVMRSARQLSALAAEETTAGGRAYPSMAQPRIDYEQLGEAVADANRRAGLGHTRLYVGKRQLGETIEPDVSRATYQRANKSATGRAARMVLA